MKETFNLCFENTELDVKLEQERRSKRFRVTYGLEVRSGLGYSEAAKQFGQVMFHALACESKLNNEGPN